MTKDQEKVRRALKGYSAITHDQAQQLADDLRVTRRSVLAQAVREGVVLHSNERDKPSSDVLRKAATLRAQQEEARETSRRDALHEKIEEEGRPFTTGIFHPLFLPTLIFVLIVVSLIVIFRG